MHQAEVMGHAGEFLQMPLQSVIVRLPEG